MGSSVGEVDGGGDGDGDDGVSAGDVRDDVPSGVDDADDGSVPLEREDAGAERGGSEADAALPAQLRRPLTDS